jgi:hypothetical protein
MGSITLLKGTILSWAQVNRGPWVSPKSKHQKGLKLPRPGLYVIPGLGF